jgi:hypothetical protein
VPDRRSGDVQGVDDSGNVTKDGQQDVDEEVGTATALKEDTKRREEDGNDDLDDVAAREVSTRVDVRVPRSYSRRPGGRGRDGETTGRRDSRSGERHAGGVGLKVLGVISGVVERCC